MDTKVTVPKVALEKSGANANGSLSRRNTLLAAPRFSPRWRWRQLHPSTMRTPSSSKNPTSS